MSNKILIIDDDMVMQQVIKSMLLSQGHDIKTAGNGKEGLEIAKNFQPDIIMLDIIMPVMSGFDFLKQYKNDTVPIIILSSLGQEENEIRVKALGAKYFLHKENVHLGDIKNKINEVLKEKDNK